MKDPYKVLGLTESASSEELTERYEMLKAKFSEDRFLSGDKGNQAAVNLSELEIAWTAISNSMKKKQDSQTYGGDYGSIDNMIKSGRYDDAQMALDTIYDRQGEWHYLQSIIYYKREWLAESRAQLQMAVNIDPFNDKYKSALSKLDAVMGSPQTDPRTIGVDPTVIQSNQTSDGRVCGNTCSNCCAAYCITDCCCSLAQCC